MKRILTSINRNEFLFFLTKEKKNQRLLGINGNEIMTKFNTFCVFISMNLTSALFDSTSLALFLFEVISKSGYPNSACEKKEIGARFLAAKLKSA